MSLVTKRSFMSGIWKTAGAMYRQKVGKELTAHGLLYEDCMIETEEVKLALARLPAELASAREQRLKRAMVLSSQYKTLPTEVADKIDPFQSYLSPYLEEVKKERMELLNK